MTNTIKRKVIKPYGHLHRMVGSSVTNVLSNYKPSTALPGGKPQQLGGRPTGTWC